MKRNILSLVCIIGFYLLNAQPNFEWANQFGPNCNVSKTTIDASGNCVFVGYASGAGDIDPGPAVVNVSPPAGAFYMFVIKVDAQGNTIFTKVIPCTDVITPNALTTDASGNIYVTGGFGSTTDFDPGAGVYNLVSAGNLDYFVLKLNSSGDFVWAKRTGNTADGYGLGITVDGSGNVYTAIYFQSTIDFDPGPASFNLTAVSNPDCCVQKLDANGNFVWARQIVTSLSMDLSGIAIDNSDNLIIYGNYEGVIDMNPGTGSANFTALGGFDLYVMKWTSSGTYVWGKSFGSTASDYQKQFTLDNSSNIILTGLYSASIDVNPNSGVYNLTPLGNYDAFIVKLDNAGNFVFGGSIGGVNIDDIIYAIDTDGNDDIYITGGFNAGTVDFDPSAGIFNLTTSVPQSYLLKISPAGSLIWAYQLNATVNSTTSAMTVSTSGEIYSFGRFNGTVDFDPTSNVNTLTVASSMSFIQKLSQCLNTNSNLNIIACENYISPSGNYTWANSGIYQDTIQNVSGCDSIITINLTIVNAAAPIASSDQSFCNSATISDLSAFGTSIQWYADASGGSPLAGTTTLVNGSTYFASQSISGCESATRLAVIATINTVSDISISSISNTFIANNALASYVWLDCANNYSIIADEIGQSFTPSTNGSFAVQLNENGCMDTSACVSFSILDVKENISGNQINIYPNPQQGNFTIDLNETIEQGVVEISDLQGRIIQNEKFTHARKLDLTLNEPEGIYILSITSQQGNAIFRLVKE